MSSLSTTVSTRPTVTVGIPTCYGEASIIVTVQSILASRDVTIDRFIIVSDRIPLPKDTQAQLKELGVELFWNENEGSYAKKLKQMVDMCDTDIFIATQDDVIFEGNAIAQILGGFKNHKNVTMIVSHIEPLPPKKFVEGILSAAVRVPGRISRNWRKGDNYLASNGRCLSFRTAFIKKFRIPEYMVSSDAFLYLENKRLGGTILQAVRSIVYIRQPQTVEEQLGPSSRYLVQKEEMVKYFTPDISSEYHIPIHIGLYALLTELVVHPVNTLLYLPILVYSRMNRRAAQDSLNPLWQVDKSTKDIADTPHATSSL